MASLKWTILLMVTLAYVSTVHCEDDVKQTLEKIGEQLNPATEKGFFDSFKDKISGYYEKAVENGKEAIKTTQEAVSDQYNKLKEKAKEFIDNSSQ